jgi:hypothetical protein
MYSPLHRVGYACVHFRLTMAQIAIFFATAQHGPETVRPSPVAHNHAFSPLRCLRSANTCATAALCPQESSIEHRLFAGRIRRRPSPLPFTQHLFSDTRCHFACVYYLFQHFLSHFRSLKSKVLSLSFLELHAEFGRSLALKAQYPVYRRWRVRSHSHACTITKWMSYFCSLLFTVGQHAKKGVQD